MRSLRNRGSLPLLALLLLPSIGGTAEGDADPIDRLIAELGSAEFERRERASRKLLELGESAEPAIRRAAKEAGDAEIQARAAALLDLFPFRCRIVDEAGKPVSNADYSAEFWSPDSFFTGMPRWKAADSEGRLSLPIKETIEVEGDTSGGEEVKRKLPILYDIQIRAPGYAPAFLHGVTSKTHEATVVLRRGVPLRGKILSAAGAPLTGEAVSLLLPNPVGVWFKQESRTDKDGRFAFRIGPPPPSPDGSARSWQLAYEEQRLEVHGAPDGKEPEGAVFTQTALPDGVAREILTSHPDAELIFDGTLTQVSPMQWGDYRGEFGLKAVYRIERVRKGGSKADSIIIYYPPGRSPSASGEPIFTPGKRHLVLGKGFAVSNVDGPPSFEGIHAVPLEAPHK